MYLKVLHLFSAIKWSLVGLFKWTYLLIIKLITDSHMKIMFNNCCMVLPQRWATAWKLCFYQHLIYFLTPHCMIMLIMMSCCTSSVMTIPVYNINLTSAQYRVFIYLFSVIVTQEWWSAVSAQTEKYLLWSTPVTDQRETKDVTNWRGRGRGKIIPRSALVLMFPSSHFWLFNFHSVFSNL